MTDDYGYFGGVNMLYTLLSQYYAQDVPNQIQVFEYVHSTNPDTVQPLLVMWYK